MTLAPAYLAALLGSIALAAGLTPLAIALARRWGLVDLPNARKVHAAPTPRVGGAAIALATVGGAGLALAVAWAYGAAVGQGRELIALLTASAVVFGVGLADDLLDVPSKFKLLALLAASAALCGGGVVIDALIYNSGATVWPLGYAAWPVTMLWVVGVTVSLNFMDGLDGLAGGIGAIASAVLAAALVAAGQADLAACALALCGALLGFLWFNAHPARVFMGDGGSMFVGFALAGLCVAASGRPGVGATTGLVLPALALGVPISDTALTLVRRSVLQRRSMFSAEDGHLHHRLLNIGLGQKHAVWLIWGVTLAAALVGWVATLGNGWATLGGLALLVPLMVGLFRTAGSVRARETVAAVRRNRRIGREATRYRRAFEDSQLRFAGVIDFAGWWAEACRAAEALDFVELVLPVTRRDGTGEIVRWRADGAARFDPGGKLAACQTMDATVPLRQRRVGEPLRVEVRIAAGADRPFDPRKSYDPVPRGRRKSDRPAPPTPDCPGTDLESAGRRLALFSRLIDEHSLASLEDPDRRRRSRHRRPAPGVGSEVEPDALPVGPDAEPPPEVEAADVAASDEPADLSPPDRAERPRVAIVHDFLYTYAGAERVLEQMVEVFPDADLFSLFDFLPPGQRGFIKDKPVTTSFIQRLPYARTKHRSYLPLMPMAIEQLDVGGYDVVLSSSYLAAKGVITRPDQLHVCYCHSPVRFAWDLQHQYLAESQLAGGHGPRKALKSVVARGVLHYLRQWDVRTAHGVDLFLANSDFVGRRIRKVYRRSSVTVYPPVDTEGFRPAGVEVGSGKSEVGTGGAGGSELPTFRLRHLPTFRQARLLPHRQPPRARTSGST